MSAPTPTESRIGIEGILKYRHEGCFQLAQELLTLCPHNQEEDAVLNPQAFITHQIKSIKEGIMGSPFEAQYRHKTIISY